MKKLPTVTLDKIVTISFRSPKEGKIKVCITLQKPSISQEISYISPQSPLARAILNHYEGEELEFFSPSGLLRIKILSIL